MTTITQPATPTTQPATEMRILRRAEVLKRLGVGKTTLADWQDEKSARYRPDFPKKIHLGANSIGYLESEINAFILSLANSRT